MLQVVLLGLRSKSNQMQCSPSFQYFLLPVWTCTIAPLLLTNRNGSNLMVCASCFHLKPLFENRVADRMWGRTQVPVSSPLNVPFMPRHCWASTKNPLHWCGHCEKKHNGRGQFTFEQWRCTNLGNQPGLMTCSILCPADFPVTQIVENLNTASLRLTQISGQCSHRRKLEHSTNLKQMFVFANAARGELFLKAALKFLGKKSSPNKSAWPCFPSLLTAKTRILN